MILSGSHQMPSCVGGLWAASAVMELRWLVGDVVAVCFVSLATSVPFTDNVGKWTSSSTVFASDTGKSHAPSVPHGYYATPVSQRA